MSYNNGNREKNRGKSYGIFGDDSQINHNPFAKHFEKEESISIGKPEKSFEKKSFQGGGQNRQNFSQKSNNNSNFEHKTNHNTNHNANFEQRSNYNTPKHQVTTPSKPVTHSPKNFFVFDIETVPCVETARTFLNLSNEVSEDEVISKLTAYHNEVTNGQNEFFRQLFHKVICVSFIAGTIQTLKGGREKYIIKSIRTGGKNGESEEEILRGIFTYLNKHPSRLISFNGRGFDMPVLQYRAMKYGIEAKWIYNDGYYNYNHRYSIEKHCDLLDMFSNFGASARIKMTEIAALFKIPCKINGIEGGSVYETYKAGKLNEICDYCESDVIATYILYLRFMQHSGKLSTEGYNIVVENLINMLKTEEATPNQTLFAEKFLTLNMGDFKIKVSSSTQEEQIEAEQNEPLQEETEEILQEELTQEEPKQEEEQIEAEQNEPLQEEAEENLQNTKTQIN